MSTSVALIGRLTRDPETKVTPSGTTVANMRIAVDRCGDKQDDGTYGPGFFDVVAFGKTAELAEQYLSKGRQVGVFGRLTFHEWEADGSKRSRVGVNADRIDFIGSRDEGEGEGGQQRTSSQTDTDFQTSDEDIPF